MDSSVLLERVSVAPALTTDTTEVETVLVVSRSVTDSVPEVLSPALVSVNALASLLPAPSVISGASLVPVMVMVTVLSALAGLALLSVARTV